MISRALAAALLLAAWGAPAAADGEGMPPHGFVFEARLAAATTVAGGAASGAYVTMVPSLFIGGRMASRVHLGVSLQFQRAAVNAGGASTTFTSYTLAPALAVDLVKSADQKVAFFGKAEVPLGGSFAGNNNATNGYFVVGYLAGLGVRYAPHRMFAFGVEAGLLGTFVAPGQPSAISTTSIYAAVEGTFLYARR